LISEKKIDRIEDRLAGIENVLANLATKLGNLDLQKDLHDSSSQSRSSRVGPSRSPGSALVEAPTPAPFEGESSINSQSDYAREMLAQVIGSTPSIGQNEEVKLALTALSEMVSQQGQNITSSNPMINHSLADIDPSKLERPPWETAQYALEKASGRFLGSCLLDWADTCRISNYGLCGGVSVSENGQPQGYLLRRVS
jgi:hypothetical protein